MTDHTSQTPYRWWLTVLTAALTWIQAGALLQTLRPSPALAARISLPRPLEIATSTLWALIFAAITANLLRRRSAQPAILALGGFLIYSLARLWWFAQADYDQNRLPFLVVVTVCLLVYPAVSLLRR